MRFSKRRKAADPREVAARLGEAGSPEERRQIAQDLFPATRAVEPEPPPPMPDDLAESWAVYELLSEEERERIAQGLTEWEPGLTEDQRAYVRGEAFTVFAFYAAQEWWEEVDRLLPGKRSREDILYAFLTFHAAFVADKFGQEQREHVWSVPVLLTFRALRGFRDSLIESSKKEASRRGRGSSA